MGEGSDILPYYILSEADKEREKFCRDRIREIQEDAHRQTQPYVDMLVEIYNRSPTQMLLPKASILKDIIS